MKKRIFAIFLIICLLGGSFTTYVAAFNYLERYGTFYLANNAVTRGWKVTVSNSEATDTLWFPDPTVDRSTYSGHVRYHAGTNGYGEGTEEMVHITYYVNNRNYGYELNVLGEYDADAYNIFPEPGYLFDHFEIKSWQRTDSCDSFTAVTKNYYPGDVIPIDRNTRWNYELQQGYVEIYLIFKEDPNYQPDTYTVTYTDGVENEAVFTDQIYGELLSGTKTPSFEG
ncbi:MAG: hypothetical protein ACLSVG_08650, partial [Clostridia bacterium]